MCQCAAVANRSVITLLINSNGVCTFYCLSACILLKHSGYVIDVLPRSNRSTPARILYIGGGLRGLKKKKKRHMVIFSKSSANVTHLSELSLQRVCEQYTQGRTLLKLESNCCSMFSGQSDASEVAHCRILSK